MTANTSFLKNSSMRYLDFRGTGIKIRRGYPESYVCEISTYNDGKVSFANACSYDESSEFNFLHPEVYMETSKLTMHRDDCGKATGTGTLKILYLCPLSGEILFRDRHKIKYTESTTDKVRGVAISIQGEPLAIPANPINGYLLPKIDQLLLKSTRLKFTNSRFRKSNQSVEHLQCDFQANAKKAILKKSAKKVKVTVTRDFPLKVSYSKLDKTFNLVNAVDDPTSAYAKCCFEAGTYDSIEMSFNPVLINFADTKKSKRCFTGFVKLITSKKRALSATRIYPVTFNQISDSCLQSIDNKELPKGLSFQISLPLCPDLSSSDSELDVV